MFQIEKALKKLPFVPFNASEEEQKKMEKIQKASIKDAGEKSFGERILDTIKGDKNLRLMWTDEPEARKVAVMLAIKKIEDKSKTALKQTNKLGLIPDLEKIRTGKINLKI